MRNGIPMLRSEAFNEAFDNFDDAFVKALASSNPLVFDLHGSVMANLRKLTEAEAIAALRNATWQFLTHAADQEIIRSPEAPKIDAQLIRDAVLRHRQRALGRYQHHN